MSSTLSVDPLELPEILSQVAAYVTEKSLLSCALVSKTWYEVFIRHIWSELQTDTDIPNEDVIAHRHLVKTIDIIHVVVMDFVNWRFPNLDTLTITYDDPSEHLTEFIFAHPNLSHLSLRHFMVDPETDFWSRLLSFNNLKSFSVTSLELTQDQEADSFWQLCTRLEELNIGIIQSKLGNLASMTFPHLKQLYFGDFVQTLMMLASRCPSLTTIHWDGMKHKELVPQFSQLAAAKTWSGLENVFLKPEVDQEDEEGFIMSQEEFSGIVRGMGRVISLSFPDLTKSFGPMSMELIRPHFAHLKELDLTTDSGLTSPMALEILTSCPSLTTFAALRIEAADIVAGKPWVCRRLEVLTASFRFHPGTLDELQPLVLDQLARLTRLQTFCACGHPSFSPPDGAVPGAGETFDWRLEKGLGKLSALRSLGHFSVRHTHQVMGLPEVEWMVKHWEPLFMVSGTLNNEEEDVDREIKMYLKDRGIHVGSIGR